MARANVGDLVQVDISGMNAPGLSIGGGVLAPGEIVSIDPDGGELRVRLGFALDEGDVITVPVARAKLVSKTDAAAVSAALELR